MRRVTLLCAAVLATAEGQIAVGQWSTINLSTPRNRLAATATARYVYFGGGNSSLVTHSVVDVYDTLTETWTQHFLSQPRSNLSAASTDHCVYFAGGRSPALGLNETSRVDIYDESTGIWTTETLPFARFAMAAGTVDGKVFFAGGGGTVNSTWSSVQIYDEASGTWSVKRLPARFNALGTIVADKSRLCIVNGLGWSDPNDRTLDIYHAATGAWTHVLMPRQAASAALAVGKVYVLPCLGGGQLDREVDVYDIEAGTWDTLLRPTNRCSPLAAGIGPYVVFANGHDAAFTGAVYQSADVYDTRTGRWTTFPITGSVFLRALALQPATGRAYFAGGFLGAPGTDITTVDVVTFDDALGISYCTPAMPNSTGATAEIAATGFPTATDNFVTLTCRNLPTSSLGMFLVASQQGPPMQPGGSQGVLCLGGSVGRFSQSIQSADPAGHVALNLELATLPLAPSQPVLPGETWQFQYWFRDANPGSTTNTSDAIAITFE